MTSTTRYRLLMVGPILVVLLNAGLAYRALARLFDAQHWLDHTLQVLTQTEEISIAMGSVNNAARAYLLTGAKEYADRYHDLTKQVHGEIDDVAHLTGDNQSQQRRITFLRQRVAVRLGAVDAVMGMRRAHGVEALPPLVLHPALSDSPDGGPSVKFVLQQMQDEERRLLAERESDAAAARHWVVGAFGGATLLDLILLVWAFQQLINTSRDREQLAARAAEISGLNGRLSNLNAELSVLNTDLERRVEERTRELEVSNQELQAFSYSVSHDLRAPLRTIDGFSLALAEDFAEVLNAEGRDYIQRVRGGVQRMGTLIDALLQLSRVTRSDVQRERVDLSQLATLIFNELVTNESGREVSFQAEPDLVAEADSRLMRVAFENLLGNALKFTSKTPAAHIEFGHTGEGKQTVYFIRDNGAGFDMQYVDRLFTAFQRLHGDRDFKGSGIGLATVSRIIRRHHGKIWAEGAIGAGATFYFTLNG
jgi:signal transduction histidine kinase